MSSHLFDCLERKERATLANTEEHRKGVFHVIKTLKTKTFICILYINIHAVPQGERCASIIKAGDEYSITKYGVLLM